MKKGTLRGFCVLILLGATFPVGAEELYKCVTRQGTAYQSRPCAIQASQKTACTGSAADGFSGDCRQLQQQRQQAIIHENNAYTQDLASNTTRTVTSRSEFQKTILEFSQCKQRIQALQRFARYTDRPAQLLENNPQRYAASVCTEDGGIYLSCNAATNTLVTQTSSTCSIKR